MAGIAKGKNRVEKLSSRRALALAVAALGGALLNPLIKQLPESIQADIDAVAMKGSGLVNDLFQTRSASANVYYWNTTTTAAWSTGADWTNSSTGLGGTTGVVPGASDNAVFNGSSVTGNETVTLSAGVSVGTLTFNNTGTTLLESSTTTAQTLTLGTGGLTVNSGAGAVTLGNGTDPISISLNGSQTWTNASGNNLSIVAPVFGTSTTTLTLASTAAAGINFSGSLAGFTGTMTINSSGGTAGKVQFASGVALTGTSAMTINITSGGTLYVNGATLSDPNILIKATGTGNSENHGALRLDGSTFAGSLVLTGNVTIGDNTSASTISGPISGTGSLSMSTSGPGFITLSGTNTYSGVTTITNGGTLEFGGEVSLYNNNHANWIASQIVVNSGGTLALSVGGTGDFVAADIGSLTALGTATGGFKAGSIIGFDTADGNFSYSTAIANPNSGSNTLGVAKFGANTLTLSGAGTYTGGTTINAGVLQLSGGSNRLPTGTTVNFTGAGTLDLNSQSQTVAGLTIASGVTATLANGALGLGSGTVTFQGAVLNTSALTGGTLSITGATIDASAGNALIAGITESVGSLITGTGGLIVKGFGNTGDSGGGSSLFSLTNTGNNFTGGVTIASGLLAIGSGDGVLGNAANAVTIIDGAIGATGTGLLANTSVTTARSITLSGAGSAYFRTYLSGGAVTMTLNGAINGAGGLYKTDGGTLILGTSNTYTGGTTIGGGVLKLGNAGALGTPSGTNLLTINSGGSLDLAGFSIGSTTKTITLTGTGSVAGFGAIGNSGGDLSNLGVGNMIMTGNTSIGSDGNRFDFMTSATLNGGGFTLTKIGNDFMGVKGTISNLAGLIINAGTWDTETNTALGSGGVTISGGTLFLYNARSFSNTITSTGGAITSDTTANTLSGSIVLSSGTLTLQSGASNPNLTLGGIISGAGNLTKTGSNTVVVSNSNTYTGITTLNGGVLKLTNANALPGGIGVSGGISSLTLNGGVLGLGVASSTFARGLGTGATQVQFTGNGGFAGYAATTTVNIGGAAANINWGATETGSWIPTGNTLTLGAADDTNTLTFANTLTLTSTQTVNVVGGAAAIDAIFSGPLLTGSMTLVSSNGSGVLELTGGNDNSSFKALVSSGATLILAKTSSSTLHAIGGGGAGTFGVVINSGGTVQLAGTGGDQIYNGGTDGGVNDNGIFDMNGASETINNIAGSGTITNSAASTLSTLTIGAAGSSASTFSGLIQNGAGTLGLAVAGSTLTLSGSNTYTGGTTVSAGVLAVTSTLGNTAINLTGGTLSLQNATAISQNTITVTSGALTETVGNAISGSTSLVLNGGTTTLGFSNSFNGAVSLNNATIILGDNNAMASSHFSINGAGIIQASTPLSLNANTAFQVGGSNPTISGSNSITVNGSYTSYGNDTLTSSITGAGNLLTLAGNVDLSNTSGTGRTMTLNGTGNTLISGLIENFAGGGGTAGSLIYSGSGKLTLSNSNTYTGGTTLSGGVLELTNANALPGGIGNTGGISSLTLNGGVLGLGLSSGNTFARSLGTTAAQVQFLGNGGFAAYAANATVTLGGSTPTSLTWGGASPTPSWIPNGSTLTLGAADDTNTVTFVNPVSFAATETVNVVGGGAAIDAIMSGQLSTGSMTLVSSNGSGVLELTGSGDNSSFKALVSSGATLILAKTSSSSVHAIGGSGSGTFGVVINSGGTVQLAGTGGDQIYNAGTDGGVNDNGIFDMNGASETINNIAGSGTITNTAAGSSTLTIGSSASPASISTFSGIIQNGLGTTALIVAAGSVTLTSSSTYTGGTTINGGTLQLNTANGQPGELSGTPSITVNTGGTLALNAGDVIGYTAGKEALTINDGTVTNITSASRVTIQNLLTMTGGTLTGTGTGDANGVYSFDNGAAGITATSDASGNPAIISAAKISLQSGNLTLNVTRGTATPASDLTISSVIAPYSTLTLGISKTGNGILTLGGSSTYTGATTISAGKLYLTGSLNAASAVSVAGSATLGGTGTVGGTATLASGGILEAGQNGTGKLTLGGLTFSGTGTINFGSMANYTATTGINVTGSNKLTDSGTANTITINVGSIPGTGLYKLISYAGSTLSAGAFGAFTLPGALPNRAFGALQNNTNEIDLNVTSIDSLYWTGTGTLASGWDTVTPNWNLNSNNTATTYIDNPGDTVVFDDRAPSANTTVNLSTMTVHPVSVTFNNSSNNYVLQGAFGIADNLAAIPTGLTVMGGGTVTLNTSNSYTGGTTLIAGRLIVGNASAMGATTSLLTLKGGTLDLANGTTGTVTEGNNTVVGGNVTILTDRATSGAGITHSLGSLNIGASTLTLNRGSNDTSLGRVNFTGATTLTGNAVFDAEGGALLVLGGSGTTLSGNFNLTVQSADGTGQVGIRANSGTGSGRTSGATTLSSGSLFLNDLGDNIPNLLGTTGTTLVLNGGTLGLQTNNSIAAYNTTIGGNVTITSSISIGTTVGITDTLGTLSIGTNTLTLSGTTNTTSGTNGLTFGATTLTGNPTFNVTNTGNGGTAVTLLTLGALNGGGSARTITTTGNATETFAAAASSITAGTALNIGSGNLVNLNGVGALGSAVTDVTNAGSLTLGAAQNLRSLTGAGNINLNANTLTLSNTTNTPNISGHITGTGGLIMAGSGTTTLSASNSYSGGTTINSGSGALLVTNANALGTGTVSIPKGATATGALQISGGITITNTFAGFGSSTTFGGGGFADIESISGTNTLTSALTVNNTGGNGMNIQSDAGLLILQGTISSTITGGGRTDDFGGAGNGLISGSIIDGTGNAAFNIEKEGAGTWTLSGSNNFSGNTTVNAGTLDLSNTNALQNSTVATGGTGIVFDSSVASHAFTFGGLGGSANLALQDNASPTPNAVALSIGNNNGTTTYSGILSAGGSITKIGTGTLTLSGSNSYSGSTSINAGKLILGVNNALPTGTTLAFTNTTGTAALDITGKTQTLANMTFGTQTTGANTVTILGNSSSSLIVTGTSLTFQPLIATAANNLTVNMSTVGSFTYSNTAGTMAVNIGTGNNFGTTTVTLAGTTDSITASSLQVGNLGGSNSGTNLSVLNLGANATINANTFGVGSSGGRAGGKLVAGSGTLTIRGTTGGSSTSNLTIGSNDSFSGDNNVYTSTFDASPGTLDARFGTVIVGQDGNISFTRYGNINASLKMGAGNLSATSMTIGNLTAGTTPAGAVNTYNIIGLLDLEGGTASITSLTLANDSRTIGAGGSENVLIDSEVTINNGSTLDATTIAAGNVTHITTLTDRINFNNGTIGNISTGSLGISGVTITLAGAAATHTFDISLGHIGTISSLINGTGGITKADTGILKLTATVEGYNGGTTVNAGVLELAPATVNQAANGLFGTSGLTINNGGTVQIDSDNALTGSGTLTANAVPILINTGGILTGLGTANANTGTSSHIRGVLTLAGGTLASDTNSRTDFGSWDLDGGVVVTANSTISALNVNPTKTGGTTFNLSSGVKLNVTGTLINGTSDHDTGINLTGSGTMTLTGSNTYAGGTTLTGGRLFVNNTTGSATGTGNVLVQTGTTLAGSQIAGQGFISGNVTVNSGGTLLAYNGATLTTGNLTFSGSTGSTFVVSLSGAPNGFTNPLISTGNLALNDTGLITVQIVGAAQSGTYDLIGYSGTRTNFNNFNPVVSAPAGFVTALFDNTAQNQIDLSVSNGYTWTGQTNGTGTLNSAWNTSGATNWAVNAAASNYTNGLNVLFNDSNAVSGGAISSSTVTIQGAGVTPASVIFDNSTVNYLVNNASGAVGIADSTSPTDVNKSSAGTVIFAGTNTYTGGTNISGGILQVNVDHALGNTSTTAVSNGGELKLSNVAYGGSQALTLAGTGTDSALFATGTSSFAGNINLSDNSSIGAAAGSTLTLTGDMELGGQGLTLTGGGTINIGGSGINNTASGSTVDINGATVNFNANNGYGGTTTVENNGLLRLHSSSALPTFPTPALVVQTGGTLDLNGNSSTVSNATLSSGTINDSLSTATLSATNVNVNGTGNVINAAMNATAVNLGANATLVINSAVTADLFFMDGASLSGTGNITNAGNGAFLGNNNTLSSTGILAIDYVTVNGTGNQITSGTVAMSIGSTIAPNASLAVNSGAILGGGGYHIVSGTITGGGTVHGTVDVQAGGHIAPGDSAVGTMAIDNLTLESGSILDFEFNNTPANDFINVTASGGLTLNSGVGFNLYKEGTANPFNSPGTYHLIGYNTGYSGSVSNLSVLDPQSGATYIFTDNTSLDEIDLTIITPPHFSVPNPTNINVLLNGNAAAVVTNDGGSTGSYNTSNASGLSIVSNGTGSLAGGTTARIVLALPGNNVYAGSSSGSFTITNSDPSLSDNTENVTVNVVYGKALANNTDYDYTHSVTAIPTPSQLSHNMNANNDPLFLTANALTADVTAGAPYDGLSSTVTGTTNGGSFVGTTATILKGNADVGKTVTMNWRNRSASEIQPPQTGGPMAHPNEFLISDVVLITGMGLNGNNTGYHVQTDIFALSMSYAASDLPADETAIAGSGGLYLGWLSPTTNTWLNAVDGDFGTNLMGFQGAEAFSLFFANNGNLSNDLGAWGVDTTNHTVWAVLDHNSEFGVVVPEPTSLGLLGLGAMGLLGRKRRKNRA